MQTAHKLQPFFAPQDDPGRPLSVLILDDMEADRMRLRRFCRKAGLEFELHEAEDLAGFRAILDAQKVDIAFLDYHLASDTGLDALKILTSHEEQVDAIPIMVTSVDRHDVVVDAMRSGCADYLTKEELSVSSIRKSIASAFERRILIAALNEAQSSRNAIRVSVSRFAETCGPEIRSVMSATIRHVRTMRQKGGLNDHFATNLSDLEHSCIGVFEFLDEVKSLLDGRPRSAEIETFPAQVRRLGAPRGRIDDGADGIGDEAGQEDLASGAADAGTPAGIR